MYARTPCGTACFPRASAHLAEGGAEHRMGIFRQIEGSRARHLDGDGPIRAGRVYLDGDMHGRAGPAVDQLTPLALARLALEHRFPLAADPLAARGAHPEAEHGGRGRRIGRSGGRLPGIGARAGRAGMSLGELDHDAQGFLRMEEGLLPGRVGIVAPHGGIALSAGTLARLIEARHLEGHVVNAGAALGQEAMEKAVAAEGLEDLDAAAAFEAPDGPDEGATGGPAVFGHAAQRALEKSRHLRDTRHGNRDVIEAWRSEEHTSELQSHHDLVCRLLLEK